MKLRYAKTTILVSAMSPGPQGCRPPQTFSQFPLPNIDINKMFMIQGKSIQTSIDKALGYSNVNVPDMDNTLFVYGKDEAFIKSLLTQDIKNAILKLNSKHGIKVGIENSDCFDGKIWKKGLRFQAAILKISTDEEEYKNLINIIKLFYDALESKV